MQLMFTKQIGNPRGAPGAVQHAAALQEEAPQGVGGVQGGEEVLEAVGRLRGVGGGPQVTLPPSYAAPRRWGC